MKKTIITVLAALMLTTAAFAANEVTVTEAGNFHIFYNDIEQRFTDVNGAQVLPLVNNGTTYLPVRAMSNLAGLGVEWVAETSTIKLTSGGTQSTYSGTPTGSGTTVNVTVADNFTITLDGTVKTFTDVNGTVVYPIVNKGTTYLPVRAVCGLVNIAVEWDGTTSSIYLGTHTAAPAVTPTVGSRGIDVSAPEKAFTTAGSTTVTLSRCYTVDTTGYAYLRATAAAVMDDGSVCIYSSMEDAMAGNNAVEYAGFKKGTEVVLDVSEYSTVVLKLRERKPSETDVPTAMTVTLEAPAAVPSYSIPSGATALTDANTTFHRHDTVYSNGQFVRHNSAPLSHTPGGIKFQNAGYTTLSFTVTTKSSAMYVNIECNNSVPWHTTQAPNTTETHVVDITGLTAVGFRTFTAGGFCDSVITNAYVE